MNSQIDIVLGRLRTELAQIYGKRLKGVYLFGSYARHEAVQESDIDVLIVLNDVENYSAEIDRTGELISDLSLELGTTISRVFTSEQRWLTDQSNFYLNVREEAVPV